MAIGSVEPLKRRHDRWEGRIRVIDVLVRQAHPGPGVPPYRTSDQKAEDAEAYRGDEAIPWTVVIDDVGGTVHRRYGGLASPAYLIGTDGRVSFFQPTAGAPRLDRALRELTARGGQGVVAGGVDPVPHLLAPLAAGWRALRRGHPQSTEDLRRALPGSVVVLHLGDRLRPLLAPLALRSRPMSPLARSAVLVNVVSVVLVVSRWRGHTGRRHPTGYLRGARRRAERVVDARPGE